MVLSYLQNAYFPDILDEVFIWLWTRTPSQKNFVFFERSYWYSVWHKILGMY